MPYYYIRVYDKQGKPIATRCEKAPNPREACRLAYGIIYDRPTDTARYVELGTRMPAYMSQKLLATLTTPDKWKRIPQIEPRPPVKKVEPVPQTGVTKVEHDKKYLYVLSQEHYHFPPNHSDMVAATPREIYKDFNAGRVYAHRMASEHAKRYNHATKLLNADGKTVEEPDICEVREFNSQNEYRVWVDWVEGYTPVNDLRDRFVWVVRRVEFKG